MLTNKIPPEQLTELNWQALSKTCPLCQKSYFFQDKRQKYCSKVCGREKQRQKNKELNYKYQLNYYYRRKKLRPLLIITCKICEKKFKHDGKRGGNVKTCSLICSSLNWRLNQRRAEVKRYNKNLTFCGSR